MDILKEVLDEIKPSEDEAKEVMSKVDAFIKSIKIKDAEIVLGGSGAKGTWLKEAFDIDLFVRFDDSYHDKDISLILEKAIKRFNPEKFHGSRDYFQVKTETFTYEIVPVIKIKEAKKAFNITDASPLHAEWVKKNSSQKVKDDIRLAKKFFKAHELYGAESYIKGFSGYVLEILTIHYGGFIKLLKASKKWKKKQVIDLAKHHKDVFFEVNNSKLESPIIVIDPVQPGRNAAAALSLEKFKLLQNVANKFLKTPSKDFFEKTKLDLEKLKKLKNTIVLEVIPFEGKEDVVGCKIEKAFNFFMKELDKKEFKIKKKGWEWDDKVLFYYQVEKEVLSHEQLIYGPPVEMEHHAQEFKKKYKHVKEVKGKLVAKIKRKYISFDILIRDVKISQYLKDKVKSVRII